MMKAKTILCIIGVALAFTACESVFPDDIGISNNLTDLQAVVRDSTNTWSVIDVTVNLDTKIYDWVSEDAIETIKDYDFGEVEISPSYMCKPYYRYLKLGADGKLHASFAVSRNWNEDETVYIRYREYSSGYGVDSRDIVNTSVELTIPAVVWYNSGAVDMGLSVKWAATNLGASTRQQTGHYYAFGVTTPGKPSDFSIDNYDGPGSSKGDISGMAAYDAATAALGAPWRTPTAAEWEELCNNCILYDGRSNGVSGLILESKINGNMLFLPACGHYVGADALSSVYNCYWSSTPFDSYFGKCFEFYKSNNDLKVGFYDMYYYKGLQIRPVKD